MRDFTASGGQLLIPPIIGSIRMGQTIGRGPSSILKECIDSNNGENLTCKLIPKTFFSNNNAISKYEHELKVLQSISHRNIVSTKSMVNDKDYICITMEKCNGESLYQHILNNGALSEEIARPIFVQIVETIAFLHSQEIAHRNIKLESILIDDSMSIKLYDFESSHFMMSHQLLSTQCGSPLYAPPEMINAQPYDGKSSDIWSLGVTLYAMLVGSLPWSTDSPTIMMKQILRGEVNMPPTISPQARDLISQMLSTNPMLRPTAVSVLSHQWFKSEFQEITLKKKTSSFQMDNKAAIVRPRPVVLSKTRKLSSMNCKTCDPNTLVTLFSKKVCVSNRRSNRASIV